MLPARGQSTAVLQQQHVDRPHRHTIHTTSASMAHANGPTARCHFSTCPFIFSQLQRSVCTNGIYSLLPQYRYILRMCTMYQWFYCCCCLFLSLHLSLSLFKGTSHNNIAISLPTLLFFRSYNEVFVHTAFIHYFLSGTYYFSICDHGPDSLQAVICDKLTFFPLPGGCSESLGAFTFSLNKNGGLLPDIIPLTQWYHHMGTRLNAMKRFCICSL